MARAFEVVDHSKLFTEYEDESDCVAFLRMLANEMAYQDALGLAFERGVQHVVREKRPGAN